MRLQFLTLLSVIVLMRVLFLTQPIQGDDIYYLAGAQHAQIDPLHPGHARYVFVGDVVDMRGHPHPPLNSWYLGAVLALLKDVREVPFHSAYLLFSLIAGIAMWMLAQQFVPARALLASLLFIATPAFVINGTSLEADLPFLAFWMAGIALFIRAVDAGSWKWLSASVIALSLAALAAYQSVVVIPILWLYAWGHNRGWKPAWAASLTPAATLALWQAFERASTGALPATVLAGHFQTYNLQSLHAKLTNAAALTVHAGWMIFPLLSVLVFRRAWPAALIAALGGLFLDANPLFWVIFACGVLVIAWCGSRWRDFLAQWVLIFFAAALVLFFAGSARYLLPVAAPLALLAAREAHSRRWLHAAIACQFALSLALAWANYQHWDGYRKFAHQLAPDISQRRTWINGEWGLRFYAEREGGLALKRGETPRAGDLVLQSDLGFPITVSGGGQLVPYREQEIETKLPLRLLGLNARSAYSSAGFGLRPFDISAQPVDRLRASLFVVRKPTLSYLTLSAPEAAWQVVSGVHADGWTSRRAVLLVKPPDTPLPLRVDFYVPDNAPARQIRVTLDGKPVAGAVFEHTGLQSVVTGSAVRTTGDSASIGIAVDKTFSVPGDQRQLGVVLTGAGFR